MLNPNPLASRLTGLISALFLCTSAMAGEAVKATPTAKVVRGRTGPVELELAVFSRKLKLGESLFVRTAVQNNSTDTLAVSEWIYRGSPDVMDDWAENCRLRIGTFLEVRDSAGRAAKPGIHISHYDVNPFDVKVSTPDAGTADFVAGLRSKGLSDEEINSRLEEYAVEKERTERDKKYPAIKLGRGQSAVSASWCSGRSIAVQTTCPGNGYVELPIFVMERPGRYEIRAVRDFRPVKGVLGRTDKWDVRVATPWVSFVVAP